MEFLGLCLGFVVGLGFFGLLTEFFLGKTNISADVKV